MPAEYDFRTEYSGTRNIAWNSGTSYPTSPQVVVVHRFVDLGFPGYQEYRLHIFITYYNSQINWLNISGSGIINGIKTALVNTTLVNLNFQNLESLPTGDYKCAVNFMIEGFDGVAWRGLEGNELIFNLTVGNGNPIKTEKQLYTVYYDKSANSISGELNVNILSNTGGDSLDFEGDGSTFSPALS